MADRTDQQLDALVIGGGAIGLACAWRAAQRGLRVRVLERHQPGAGASGVAAGMLAPVGEATWGEEELLRLALDSHALWPGFAAELASASERAVGYSELGALHIALDRDDAAALRRRFELMQALGLEAEWLRPGDARELEPGLSPQCAAAVHAPTEAAVAPAQLVAALVEAATRAGVEVIPGTDAVDPLLVGDRLAGVCTAEGTEHWARRTVAACGAWSGAAGWLPEFARPPVRPVKGQILTLRAPTGPVCERIVASERVYIVPRADNRLVVGATVEEQGFDTRLTAGGVHELLREAYRALPEVAELELVEAKAGVRPGSPDNAPVIGAGALEGLVLASGHFRSGLLLAPATAAAVADLLCEEAPELDVGAFTPARFERQAVAG